MPQLMGMAGPSIGWRFLTGHQGEGEQEEMSGFGHWGHHVVYHITAFLASHSIISCWFHSSILCAICSETVQFSHDPWFHNILCFLQFKRFGLYLYPQRVQFQRVQVRCVKVRPGVYPWWTLSIQLSVHMVNLQSGLAAYIVLPSSMVSNIPPYLLWHQKVSLPLTSLKGQSIKTSFSTFSAYN